MNKSSAAPLDERTIDFRGAIIEKRAWLMPICKLCHTKSLTISHELGVCLSCIRYQPEEALPIAMDAHRRSRRAFGLPEEPPKDPNGAPCNICVNECRIPEHATGYCGLRRNEGGRLVGVSADVGKVSWYHDPHPANRVGGWSCPEGPGIRHPKYANCPGPGQGCSTLAVFFHACSFNCLFCQNWEFKLETLKPADVRNLVADLHDRSSCICYFGGDPTPQIPFALKATKLARAKANRRLLRVCWETSGAMHRTFLEDMVQLSLEAGGCIKFDLKAWDDNLHRALTGVTNRRTLENFERAGEMAGRRLLPPLLIASTLLVPGYIDAKEVRSIARFIASVNPDISYSLLAFFLSSFPPVRSSLYVECGCRRMRGCCAGGGADERDHREHYAAEVTLL